MMTCQRYIFELSSGRLDDADLGTRVQARMHRMVCVRCRAFTHNDQVLTQVLDDWRARAQRGDEPPPP